MIDQTPIARKAFLTLSIIAVLSFGNKLVAQNGEAIFRENGKYFYMNEAGKKKKIKESELRDKTQ